MSQNIGTTITKKSLGIGTMFEPGQLISPKSWSQPEIYQLKTDKIDWVSYTFRRSNKSTMLNCGQVCVFVELRPAISKKKDTQHRVVLIHEDKLWITGYFYSKKELEELWEIKP